MSSQRTSIDVESIPLVEEAIHVETRVVDKGGLRISKHVVDHQETVETLLQDQTVEVKRVEVGRELTDLEVPEARYEGDVFVVPVLKEVLVKRWVLVEEIHIRRIRSTHTSTHQVTLRREEISVERLAAADPAEAQGS